MASLLEELEPEVPQEEIAAAEQQPEPEQQSQESAEEPQEAQKDERDAKGKLVPLAALHEERQKRKELQAQFQQDRITRERQNAVLQARLDQLFQAAQPQPQMPGPEDPAGQLQYGLNQTQQELAQLRNYVAQDAQRKAQEAQTANLVGWYRSQAVEFQEKNDDFGGAYEHMRNLRVSELKAMGLNPAQVEHTLTQDELQIAWLAAQRGQNPAEIIYNMATSTGYRKQAKQEADPAQKMETLQRGVQASKTLGTSGGVTMKPTPQQIAEMPEEEFEKLLEDARKKGKRLSDML